jgi:hypothetical protein
MGGLGGSAYFGDLQLFTSNQLQPVSEHSLENHMIVKQA